MVMSLSAPNTRNVSHSRAVRRAEFAGTRELLVSPPELGCFLFTSVFDIIERNTISILEVYRVLTISPK